MDLPYLLKKLREHTLHYSEQERAAEVLQSMLDGEKEVSRMFRILNGLDIDDADKRAEHVMQTMLDGLTICPANRLSVKAYLAEHFADLMKHCDALAAVIRSGKD